MALQNFVINSSLLLNIQRIESLNFIPTVPEEPSAAILHLMQTIANWELEIACHHKPFRLSPNWLMYYSKENWA